MIEKIVHNGSVLAIIIFDNFKQDGIHFFTQENYSQQLGYMNRPAGYQIPPHVHNPVPREVIWTQEVLFIKSGKIRVDFYDDDRNYLESRILNKGDIILLSGGGHGFEMLENSEIIEVKQGPYCGDKDKTRFEPLSSKHVNLK